MSILTKWFATVLGFFVAATIVPGFSVEGLYIALIAAVLLGFLNITLKPLLVLLTLPVSLLTFGLFVWVINGFVLWFLASFVSGLEVSGFFAAFVGSLVISVVVMIVDSFAR